jgi:hypothetical protein
VTLLILLCAGIILYFVSLVVQCISTKQVWPWLWIVSTIGISILLISILIVFEVIPSNDDLKGFAGNIAAEGIGIVLTILIIDRLIKIREEKRLLATKQIVYARLLFIIDRPLEAMSQLFPGEYCKSGFNIYMYGFIPDLSNITFDNLSTLRTSISTYVEQEVEERASIQVSANNTPITRSNIY